MTLTIGINALPYTPGGQGGAEAYLASVIRALADAPSPHRFVLFVNADGAGGYLPAGSDWREVVVPLPYRAGRIARVAVEQTLLPLMIARFGIDAMFSNYVAPILAPCAQVVNIHDMLYRAHPEWIERSKLVYWRALVPRTARSCRVILTDSRYSADQIERFLPFAAGKVRVSVAAVKRSLLSVTPRPAETLERLGVRPPYVLSAGSFARHKNVPRLIDAFVRIAARHPDASLVLLGLATRPDTISHMEAIRERTRASGVSDRIRFTGFVSEVDLASLYAGASVFVIPSLFEGFGLPILEAQYFGCPVVASTAASLPEVAGGAALLVDPTDVEGIAAAVSRLLSQPEERNHLTALGRANVGRYSWSAAARDVIRACEDAARARPTPTRV